MARSTGTSTSFKLHGWLDPTVLAVSVLALFAGFGQFGAVAALGDVAKHFGHITSGATIADQAGLSGTELGIGLAILRLASIASFPITALADRLGRRQLIVSSCVLGLAMTAIAAASPSYWWFVALFAVGRPLLSTTVALAQVSAAEETNSGNRTRAIALVTAGYGVGSGLIAIVHSLAGKALGFRLTFLLALLPLALTTLIGKRVREPDRFALLDKRERIQSLFAVMTQPMARRRVFVVAGLAFGVAAVTGPITSFIFLYSQNVLHMSGVAVAAMIAGAGITGLVGLVLGQFFADRAGRRVTGAVALLAIGLFGAVSYSGSKTSLVIGYVLGVLAASALGPAAGALGNELFPTAIRASVAGIEVAASVLGAVCGLLLFGALADVGNRFSIAAIVTGALAVPGAALFALLPETRGKEPEELWPEGLITAPPITDQHS